MASFLRPPHKNAANASTSSSATPTISSRNPPPTSFRADLASTGVATRRLPRETLSPAAESAKLTHRNSRVDLDFEQALASQDTFKLHEGPDIATMGMGLEAEREDYSLSGDHNASPPANAVGGARGGDNSRPSTATRKLKKSQRPSSPPTQQQGQIPNSMSPMIQPSPANSSRPSISDYSSVGGSPVTSTRDLQDDSPPTPGAGGPGAYPAPRQEEVKRRNNIFRSAGTASSPDLGTIVRKKKSSHNQTRVPALPGTSSSSHQHHNNEHGDYDDGNDAIYASTDAPPSNMSNWTATLAGRNRSLSKPEQSKGSPRTLRAKTGTFLSNIFSHSPGTVRDRSKYAESSQPSTPHRSKYDRPFEDSPPVPHLPLHHQHRSGPTNVADIFAPSGPAAPKAGRRASKPLPPIVRSSASMSVSGSGEGSHQYHQHEMAVSPVDTNAGSVSSHAPPQIASGLPATPSRRPVEVASRIQANSGAGGRRRRSMSVGDAESWVKIIPINNSSSPSKGLSPQPTVPPRNPSPQPAAAASLQNLSSPERKQRPVSASTNSSTSGSGYATARSDTTSTPGICSRPTSATTPSASTLTASTAATHGGVPPSRDWKNALDGWDQLDVSTLEIKDPSASLCLSPPGSTDPTMPGKNRPRSRTQDPMPIPPKLTLGKTTGGTIRAGSMGSPPAGFSLPTEPSSSSSLNANPRSPSFSLYSTPPSGPPSASPSFSSQQQQATPTRRGSTSPTVPFTGPVIIGTTPASIGHTTTKVTIQRGEDPKSQTPMNSPKLSTSPSAGSSPISQHSSPITPHSGSYSPAQTQQRRSSSSHRSASPQLLPPNAMSQAIGQGGRAGTSLRVSSLRGQARPALNILGTPSTSPSSAAGTLRNTTTSPSRNETYSGSAGGAGSPKISLSLTSPSQENLRHGIYGGANAYAARQTELRMIYGALKNPASASEPTLVPPGSAADETVKTIRIVTSGSKLGSGGSSSGSGSRGDVYIGESGELSSTRISSPTSSVKHMAFSTASAGTSVGRSSVSRDGSAGTMNGSASLSVGAAGEEMEAKAEAIAQRIWEEDEMFKSKEKFSEWLGQPDALNAVARRYYMDHFDFTNMRLDVAFRRLCAKLFLRAESQALDRILIEFSRRYWEGNSNCALGSASNVHQVVYSLLLLNTDLHVADLAHHMTKQQFISNTVSTLVAPSHTSSSAPTPARSSSPVQDHELTKKASTDPMATPTVNFNEKGEKSGPPISIQNTTLRVKRSGSVTSWKGSLSREGTKDSIGSTSQGGSGPPSMQSGTITENSSLNGSTVSFHETAGRKHTSGQASVTSLPTIGQKAWESEVETYLKDIYAAIRSSQILQPQGTGGGGLSPGSSLGRGASQRRGGNGMGTMKRNSIRGIPGFISAQQGINGSNSSVDGRLSPSPSFSTSINDVMTASSSTLFTPALGFAMNLSNTIIREAQEDDLRSINSDTSDSTDVSISDEELALLGAPWAKEGMLQRKQYWESTGKRSKNKNWMEVFVVIQRGQLNMFTFNSGGSSGGGSAAGTGQSGVVGGGNWLNNATSVGEHMLAHSLAHVLPPPGLPRRAHCFVLTLASGMGFFFQAGTEELANEWVSTCNYWAARQSKEPLAGGVSNMEYGWSRVEPEALAADDYDPPPSIKDSSDNFSLMSGKSKMGARFDGFSTMRGSPFADRVYINDWRAPGHSMVASAHDEETQLEALQRQADKLDSELKKHIDLREPMIGLYPPKSSNLAKAMVNWESRAQYLQTEMVKYKNYIESLRSAMKERLRRRGEKALERALLHSADNITPGPNQRAFGFADEEAIQEGQETETEKDALLTPGANRVQFKVNPVQNQQHKRDAAEATA